MRRVLYGAIALCFASVVLGQVPGIEACVSANPKQTLRDQAQIAVSENSADAQAAIESLRKAGPEGLEVFLAAHQEAIDTHRANLMTNSAEPEWQRLKAALDAISGQRDCHASKLFWYTDFEAAKAAAQESGKPILSLRLLGKLTDEFSCANSRFFRSTLYANEEVSRVLREQFILHWQSVRPVPKVTIDFGDGRKLERTLTGNSIHYILDSEGRTIDALPGLYGPKAFLRGLNDARTAFLNAKDLSAADRAIALQKYHQGQIEKTLTEWQADLKELGLAVPNSETFSVGATATAAKSVTVAQQPRAAKANRLAGAKGQAETVLLVATLPDAGVLANATDEAVWGRIAELHVGDAELDAASRAFIAATNPNAGRAGAVSMTKMAVENPIVRLVRNFQNTISIDTVRNEYTLRRQIHEWLANEDAEANMAIDALNERVYAELFLTPSSDPWLGLVPGDVYTALDNNGVATN